MSKLSVVLPVAEYNTQWLERSLASTVGVADELVIVTDGSQHVNDMVGRMANIPKCDLLIIAVCKRGLCRALNTGICAASGDWISFLCSDDWYDVEGAKLLKPYLGEADIIGGITHSTGHLGENYWPRSGDISRLETECAITSPAYFRKELWWCVHGYSDLRYLDWHFWKKCIAAGASYKFYSTIMYHYQAWPGTISAQYSYTANLGHEWGDGPKEDGVWKGVK